MRYDPSFNPDVTYYYQQDHEGSVTHLLNTSGNVIESYKYDAFGAPAIYDGANPPNQLSSSAYSNRFLFTGREYANLFGFYEYRARAYHPMLGRFMSEDPKLFDAGDYNLFRYCHNEPIDFTDPMGLEDIYISAAMDRLGIQASLNSRAASMNAGDGHDRSQLIQAKGGHLSLQNKFWAGQDQRTHKFEGGRWKTYVVGQRENAYADKGHTTKGVGHVHMDKTGQPAPHGPEWTIGPNSDMSTAQGSAGQPGQPVYKVLESNANTVYRLTPQKDTRDTPTEKVFVRQPDGSWVEDKSALKAEEIMADRLHGIERRGR